VETTHTADSSNPRRSMPTGEGGSFWRRKTIEELAAEQGVPLIADFKALLGAGKDLWSSDEEFEAWLKDLQKARREGGE
jgi:uncharacterized protein (DUF2384 family)